MCCRGDTLRTSGRDFGCCMPWYDESPLPVFLPRVSLFRSTCRRPLLTGEFGSQFADGLTAINSSVSTSAEG